MNRKQGRQKLIKSLVDLDEASVLEMVRYLLEEGENPLTIIKDCEAGMVFVGEHYEKLEYWLSGLIMAGEILRETMSLIEPFMEKDLKGETVGKVLIGTVQGDIHDIGKDIISLALRSNGFAVEDLGVDVPPDVFVEHVRRDPPDIVGLSGIITFAYESMRTTTGLLREYREAAGISLPVIIGGSTLTEQVCRFAGADFWTTDVMEGVKICRQIIKGKHS
jgi:methanogenic corrinoid protein MtbC1